MTSFTFARIWTGKVDTSRASAQTGSVGSRAGLGAESAVYDCRRTRVRAKPAGWS